MRPDVLGHQLRHRPGGDAGAPALPQPALPAADQRAAQRRPAEHRRRPDALRPHARRSSPSSTAATSPSSASASSAGAAARRPSTSARWSRPSATWSRRAARPCSSRASPRSTARSRCDQDASVPDHRRAHQRQRLQGVPRRDARRRLGHVHEDGHRADPRGRPRARRVRRLRRSRRHRSTWTRSPSASPPRRACRSCSTRTEPQVIEAGAAAHRRPGDPQLGQPRGRRAARQPLRPGVLAGPRRTARR